MKIDVAFISGFMFGVEFYSDELFGTGMILDLGTVRILVEKPAL